MSSQGIRWRTIRRSLFWSDRGRDITDTGSGLHRWRTMDAEVPRRIRAVQHADSLCSITTPRGGSHDGQIRVRTPSSSGQTMACTRLRWCRRCDRWVATPQRRWRHGCAAAVRSRRRCIPGVSVVVAAHHRQHAASVARAAGGSAVDGDETNSFLALRRKARAAEAGLLALAEAFRLAVRGAKEPETLTLILLRHEIGGLAGVACRARQHGHR